MLLEKKEIEIHGKTFIISKFPALDGYEIVTQLALTAIPKMAEFAQHKAMFIKMLAYVGVNSTGSVEPLQLTTEALINNHCGDWETMVQLGYAIYEYNVSFLADGRVSSFFGEVAANIPAWTTKILALWSEQSSPAAKQPSKSSKKVTQ
jgi:hypothetical protein